MNVRTGHRYVFHAAGLDRYSPAHRGIKDGAIVTVVRLPGCPPPNTMGHAHVNGADGRFMGLVQTASLTPLTHPDQEKK